MGCLSIPAYAEIMRSGALKFRPDELQTAAKNKGKNLPVPELPKTTVLLRDNLAVAYGESLSPGVDGILMRQVWKSARIGRLKQRRAERQETENDYQQT